MTNVDMKTAELIETDPRFPSGPWVGYYTQAGAARSRGSMDMLLTFRAGQLTGCGRDPVGNFIFRGRYDLLEGGCRWVKSYLGKHDVHYEGRSQGKGIVGRWTIESLYGSCAGGFAIWPEGEEDPTLQRLAEQLDLPLANELNPLLEPVPAETLVGVGSEDESDWNG